RVPAETDARRDVIPRIAQGLAVVPESEIEREIVARAEAVLREHADEPLIELVAADAEADWLRVVLHLRQRQLIERRRRGVEECKRAEHRGAGLAAGAARVVAGSSAAETKIVFAARP